MKNLLKLTILTLTVMVAHTAASITVTGNTPQRFSFIWQMDQWDTTTAQSGSASVTSISSPHTNMVTGENGTPVLPGYSFYVGVPLSGTATISCVPMETRSVALNHPVNTWQLKTAMPRQPDVQFTQQWVSDPVVAAMAGIRTQYHVIRPFYYDDQRQSVHVLTKATVTIQFPPAASSPALKRAPAGEFEAMIRGMIVNWDVASVWAMPPVPLAKIRKVQQSMQLTPEKKLYQFRVGDGHKNLSEGTVDENGLIRIAGSALVREFGNVPVRNITMYGSQKGELPTRIPGVSSLPAGLVRIPLIARGFGVTIDSAGYFLAYVTGASDWSMILPVGRSAINWTGLTIRGRIG